MTTCYLDPEDEITGAIGRIRSVTDGQAILVLPGGSRIATSRINFRLLAREAGERGLDLLVVSDEPGARALAISAGLPAYDTVAAAEAALTQFQQQESRLAQRTGRPARGATDVPDSTRVLPTAVAGGRAADTSARTAPAGGDDTRILGREPGDMRAVDRAGTSERRREKTRTAPLAGVAMARPEGSPSVEPRPGRAARVERRRRLPVLPLVAAALALLLVAGAAYAAYMLLPTATISLRPHVESVGPVEMTIVADPAVAVPDAEEGLIPAQRIEVPLTVRGTFSASGSQVSVARATGSVRFRSENTLFEVPIPAGTRVSTEDGVAFETTRAVTLERASFETGPSTAQVPVEAVRAGPRGNVDADAITRVPRSLASALVSVRNPRPTSGGQREEVTVIAQEDYDSALQSLEARLPAELRRLLADPSTTPRGLTIFPSSARTGPATPDRSADVLVESVAEQFSLAVDATATVLAVNEALVDEVVAERLQAQVPEGASVHPEGVRTERSEGAVVGDRISYSARGTVATYRLPDRDTLVEQVRGLSVSEAEAIMARYGNVDVSIWPDFVDRIPDQASRINLTVLSPQETQ